MSGSSSLKEIRNTVSILIIKVVGYTVSIGVLEVVWDTVVVEVLLVIGDTVSIQITLKVIRDAIIVLVGLEIDGVVYISGWVPPFLCGLPFLCLILWDSLWGPVWLV